MAEDDPSRAPEARSTGRTETPGRLVAGRYRLERLLGRGATAEVHRAHDLVLDRAVAVKLFHPGSAMSDAVRRRGEIRLLAGLSHPNLVTVFDAGTDPDGGGGGQPFLVLELVDGASLADRLRSGPLPAPEVARLGADLADALSYVHGRQIVHRDVKPGNVLLAGHAVKLADFGIARLLDEARLTATGATVGTANYLSPEQVRGLEIGPASDIYSLGLVLIEALTGTVAYPGHGIAAAAARLHRPPDIPTEAGPVWADLVTRMTAAEPNGRPAAAQIAAVLRTLTHADSDPALDAPTQLLSGTPPVSGQGRDRRRRWWALAAAAVLTTAVVALTYAIASNTTSGQPAAASRSAGGTPPTTPDSSTRPAQHSTASTPRPRPRTPAQAIRQLRAAIAHAVNSGNLDLAAATDLDHRLSDLGKKLTEPDPNPDDLAHRVADLLKKLDELRDKAQLTAAGQEMLAGPLNTLTRLTPPQR